MSTFFVGIAIVYAFMGLLGIVFTNTEYGKGYWFGFGACAILLLVLTGVFELITGGISL